MRCFHLEHRFVACGFLAFCPLFYFFIFGSLPVFLLKITIHLTKRQFCTFMSLHLARHMSEYDMDLHKAVRNSQNAPRVLHRGAHIRMKQSKSKLDSRMKEQNVKTNTPAFFRINNCILFFFGRCGRGWNRAIRDVAEND